MAEEFECRGRVLLTNKWKRVARGSLALCEQAATLIERGDMQPYTAASIRRLPGRHPKPASLEPGDTVWPAPDGTLFLLRPSPNEAWPYAVTLVTTNGYQIRRFAREDLAVKHLDAFFNGTVPATTIDEEATAHGIQEEAQDYRRVTGG